MPRPNEYSRRQYLMMQVAMWVILLASVGVAALVTRVRSRLRDVELDSPIELKTLAVQLPKGWRIEMPDSSDEAVFAVERVRAPYGRELEITEERPGFFESLVGAGGDPSLGESIAFGDLHGGMVKLVNRRRPSSSFRSRGNADVEASDTLAPANIYAYGASDDGRRITIRLTSTTRTLNVDPEDEALVKKIASSVRNLPKDDGPQIRER